MKTGMKTQINALIMISLMLYKCNSSDETVQKLDINSDVKRVYISHGVNFSLNNLSGVSEASWFFEGGEPEFFDGKVPPTVYYGKEGVYSVTANLIVDGEKQVIHKKGYILVQEEPDGRFVYVSIHAEKEIMKGGESIEVWVNAVGDNLEYVWTSNTGSFEGDGPRVEFKTGNCYEGTAEINALVSNEYGSMDRTVKVTVERAESF
jgi:hypothetical protein